MVEAFPTSGNIDPTTFPFLLMDLHRRGATGSLKVEGPSHPKALYLRGGRILFGSSNDPRDQLGSILIEQGKISQEQLDDVNAKVGPGNPLAKVLAESGFVNQRELGDAARIKVERILSDVIAYTSGSFEFEDGVLPKGAARFHRARELGDCAGGNARADGPAPVARSPEQGGGPLPSGVRAVTPGAARRNIFGHMACGSPGSVVRKLPVIEQAGPAMRRRSTDKGASPISLP